VTQVTKQLPLPAFQPFAVHQAEASPAPEDTTTEAVVINEPQEEVAQLPVEEPEEAQSIVTAPAYEPSEPAAEEQASSSVPEMGPTSDDVAAMAQDEAPNASLNVIVEDEQDAVIQGEGKGILHGSLVKEQAKSPLQATVEDAGDEAEVGQQSTSQDPIIAEAPVKKTKAKKAKAKKPKKEKTPAKEAKLQGEKIEEKKQEAPVKIDHSPRILELLMQIEFVKKWWYGVNGKGGLPRAFATIANKICEEYKVFTAEGEVKNSISTVEVLEGLLRKWEVLFNAVNTFTKLSEFFGNDAEYNMRRDEKKLRELEKTAKIYLEMTSDLFSAGNSRFAHGEKEFKQRRNSRQELLNEVMRSLEDIIGRYQQYMAALDLLQKYFPSDEVEHLIITSLTKLSSASRTP
jgi:hypothetical protein